MFLSKFKSPNKNSWQNCKVSRNKACDVGWDSLLEDAWMSSELPCLILLPKSEQTEFSVPPLYFFSVGLTQRERLSSLSAKTITKPSQPPPWADKHTPHCSWGCCLYWVPKEFQAAREANNNWKYRPHGTSLVVQWLRLHASKARGMGSIPGQETRSHMLLLKPAMAAKKKYRLQNLTNQTLIMTLYLHNSW